LRIVDKIKDYEEENKDNPALRGTGWARIFDVLRVRIICKS